MQGRTLSAQNRQRSNILMHVRYSQDHEYYIIVEGGLGTVGITNHAQEKLSDVTLVEAPRTSVSK